MKISINYITPLYKNYPVFSSRKTNNSLNQNNSHNLITSTETDNISNSLRVKKLSESEKFALLINNFGKQIEPLSMNCGIKDWDFYTNSTPENIQKRQKAVEKYYNIYNNKKIHSAFSHIDSTKLSEQDTKLLKNILKEFDEIMISQEDLNALNKKISEISQKFNSYVMKIDNKEVTNTEIEEILQNETNPKIRKKAYNAKIERGNLIAKDLRKLIKMRNNYAKKQGYENFFDYRLKEFYDVEPEFLDNLLNDVYKKALPKIKNIKNENIEEYKKLYKTNNLKAYHHGLLLDSNPDKSVNEILKKLSTKNPYIIEEISKKTYNGMGYNIDKMLDSGKLVLDLYPRKNKNTHSFCFGIDCGNDARILSNLNNDVDSIETLNHEMGHAIYYLGIPQNINFFYKHESSYAMTEAIAMMMEDIIKTENIMKDYVPAENLKGLKKSHIKKDADFIAKCAMYIEFEREMYKNPDKDPAIILKEKKLKYMNRDEKADNEWATIPHFLTHPAYYQNYFRATLMKAQIYNHLRKIFGNISENKNIADYLNKEIFSYGAAIDEYDLIKQLTGKEFSADDLCKNLYNELT